jgi:(S)-mandelate dehydrogenase
MSEPTNEGEIKAEKRSGYVDPRYVDGNASKEQTEALELRRRYPNAFDLRDKARKRLPKFAFEYIDGGAGSDGNIKRNWSSFDGIELMPRYGNVVAPPPTDTEIFGVRYSAPIGISPIGGPGTGFPGAERFLARAAQAAKIPYTLGVLSAISIEEAAEIAPDVLWLQIYRFARNDHKIGLDLARRAEAAGVKALVLTWDTPVRTTRPREVKAGITNPFKLNMRLRLDAMSSPPWLMSMMKNGIPRFVSIKPYMGGKTSLEEAARFMRTEGGGAFTWDEVKRYRDVFKGRLVVKGILHPADAVRAVEIGLDGLFVSNHGGRQIEALPASIDAVPSIAAEVGEKATIIVDSGVRSGIDAARALALGANAAFAGKAFLWSLGALGEKGPGHMIEVLKAELSSTLGQLGCLSTKELLDVARRHRTAWTQSDFATGHSN